MTFLKMRRFMIAYCKNALISIALILATYYNHIVSVEALIKCKADRNITDMWGRTASDYAEQYEYTRINELLKD